MLEKLLSLMVCVSIVLSINTGTNSYRAVDKSQKSSELYDSWKGRLRGVPMVDQSAALNNYEDIIATFEKDEKGTLIYPEECAGFYVDGEVLVIQLVDNNSEIQEKYMELCFYKKKVRFNEVLYTIEELKECEFYVEELKEKGYNIVHYGISETENCFQIYLNSDFHSDATYATDILTSVAFSDLRVKILYCGPIVAA